MSIYDDKIQVTQPSFEFYPKDALLQQNNTLDSLQKTWNNFNQNVGEKQDSLMKRLHSINERTKKAEAKIHFIMSKSANQKLACPGSLNKGETYESYNFNLINLEKIVNEVKKVHNRVSQNWLDPINPEQDTRGPEPRYSNKEQRNSIEILFKRNKIPTFDYINKPTTKGFFVDELKFPRSRKNLKRVRYLDSLILFDSQKNVFTRGREQRDMFAKKTKKTKTKTVKNIETTEQLEQSILGTNSFSNQTDNIDTEGIMYKPEVKQFIPIDDDDDDEDLGQGGVVHNIDLNDRSLGVINDMSMNQSAFQGSYDTTFLGQNDQRNQSILSNDNNILNTQKPTMTKQRAPAQVNNQTSGQNTMRTKNNSVQSNRPRVMSTHNQEFNKQSTQKTGQNNPQVTVNPPDENMANESQIAPPPPGQQDLSGMVIPPPPLDAVLGVQHGEVEKPVQGSILEGINEEPEVKTGPDYDRIFQGSIAPVLASGGVSGMLAEIQAGNFKQKKSNRNPVTGELLNSDKEKTAVNAAGDDALKKAIEQRFRIRHPDLYKKKKRKNSDEEEEDSADNW